MAGKPGRSGGARPGAGRKPKAVTVVTPTAAEIDGEPFDPRPTLELIAMGHMEVSAQQYKALVALLPLLHARKGDGGKKDERAAAAKKASAGRFNAAPAPLKLVGK